MRKTKLCPSAGFDEKLVDVHECSVASVEGVMRWALFEFPAIDRALIASWATEISQEIAVRKLSSSSIRRYSVNAISTRLRQQLMVDHTKLRDGSDLSGYFIDGEVQQEQLDYTFFLKHLKTLLSEHDRYILILLLSNSGSNPMSISLESPAALGILRRVYECFADSVEARRSTQSAG